MYDKKELLDALINLYRKFHLETDCGRPYHWAECERVEEILISEGYLEISEGVAIRTGK